MKLRFLPTNVGNTDGDEIAGGVASRKACKRVRGRERSKVAIDGIVILKIQEVGKGKWRSNR